MLLATVRKCQLTGVTSYSILRSFVHETCVAVAGEASGSTRFPYSWLPHANLRPYAVPRQPTRFRPMSLRIHVKIGGVHRSRQRLDSLLSDGDTGHLLTFVSCWRLQCSTVRSFS